MLSAVACTHQLGRAGRALNVTFPCEAGAPGAFRGQCGSDT